MSTATVSTVKCQHCNSVRPSDDVFCGNCGSELAVDVLAAHLKSLTKRVASAVGTIANPPETRKKLPLSPDEQAKIVSKAAETRDKYAPIVRELTKVMGLPIPNVVDDGSDDDSDSDGEADSL